MSISPNHPKLPFLFYIYGSPIEESAVERMRSTVRDLGMQRTWTTGPPQFVDETTSLIEGTRPRHLVGGRLDIYSALPPWKDKLPRDVDLAHLEEVQTIVSSMCSFSKATGLSIGFVLAGEDVGWVSDGRTDRMLQQGLLDEWKRMLGPIH